MWLPLLLVVVAPPIVTVFGADGLDGMICTLLLYWSSARSMRVIGGVAATVVPLLLLGNWNTSPATVAVVLTSGLDTWMMVMFEAADGTLLAFGSALAVAVAMVVELEAAISEGTVLVDGRRLDDDADALSRAGVRLVWGLKLVIKKNENIAVTLF